MFALPAFSGIYREGLHSPSRHEPWVGPDLSGLISYQRAYLSQSLVELISPAGKGVPAFMRRGIF